MTKAETGVAGSVVAEVAYRNDFIAVADSRNWPRKPGGKTDARNPNRMQCGGADFADDQTCSGCQG